MAATSRAAGADAAQSPKALLASILTEANVQHAVHYRSWQSFGAA